MSALHTQYKHRTLRWLSLLLVLCTVATVAAQPQARFAFVVNSFDNSLSAYRVDPISHRLRPNGYVRTSKLPAAVAVHPNNQFVYVVAQTGAAINIYAIDQASGRLTETAASPVRAGVRSPFAIAVHPQGNYLYLPGRHSRAIAGFSIDRQSGALTPIPGSPFAAGYRPRDLAIHPNGKTLYCVNAYANTITAYRIAPDSGRLSLLADAPYTAGTDPYVSMVPFSEAKGASGGTPYNIVIHPSGRFAYVANWTSSSVSIFAIDAQTGGLSPIEGGPFLTEPHPYDLLVDPSGRYLYTANWYVNDIVGFSINADSGAITRLPPRPSSAQGLAPVKLRMEPYSQRLYVAYYHSNDLEAFELDSSTGALRSAGLTPARIGARSVAFSTGPAAPPLRSQRAYVLDSEHHQLAVYAIDPATGGWRKRALLQTPPQPVDMAVDSLHGYVYLASAGPNQLTVYALAREKGDLRQLPAVVELAAAPASLSLDPNGEFLYVGYKNNAVVSIYAINTRTGALASRPGPPMSVSVAADRLLVEPLGRYGLLLNRQQASVAVLRYLDQASPLAREISGYGSPFKTGDDPIAVVTDAKGRFAYVLNQGSKNISAYSLHPQSGALQPVPGSPFNTVGRADAMAISPNGRFAYVVNRAQATVSVYRLNPVTGGLHLLVAGHPVGTTPSGIRIDASGQYAYITALASKRLQTFRLNPETGMLARATVSTLDLLPSQIRLD